MPQAIWMLLLLIVSSRAWAAPQATAAKSPKTSRSAPQSTLKATSETLAMKTLSTGAKTDLKKSLWPERPTVFAFYKPSSTLERDFVTSLERDAENKIGFFVIALKSGNEPVVQQYGVTETPTALVYDRRGRLVGRSTQGEEIRALVGKALSVMRIDWAEDGDPRLDAAREMTGGQKQVPGILRTMSLRPDYLQGFMAMSMRAQFTDGYIDRRTKELIATYVSAINKCRY